MKVNFVDAPRDELRRFRNGTVALGTATDPYQPLRGRTRAWLAQLPPGVADRIATGDAEELLGGP